MIHDKIYKEPQNDQNTNVHLETVYVVIRKVIFNMFTSLGRGIALLTHIIYLNSF